MDGLQQVYNLISAVISSLPAEIVMVSVLAFTGAFILGLWGWLK